MNGYDDKGAPSEISLRRREAVHGNAGGQGARLAAVNEKQNVRQKRRFEQWTCIDHFCPLFLLQRYWEAVRCGSRNICATRIACQDKP